MIDIAVFEAAHRIVVTGHALFDVKGKDVVCAAVSVTLQSWLVGCRLLCKREVLVSQKDGHFEAVLTDVDEPSLLLWKNMILTMDILVRQYPENIQMHWEDDDGS